VPEAFFIMGELAKNLSMPIGIKSGSLQQWESDLVNLGTIERHVQFYIGDKILEGEEEGYITRGKYDRVAELTGIEKSTLAVFVSVCKSINSLRRLKELDYSHHYEVAKLEPEDQEYFLNEAVKNKWSVNALREAIKQSEIDEENEQRKKEKEAKSPIIYNEICEDFLKRFKKKSIDLLLTDPPYSTDIKDLPAFLDTWIYDALDKVKDTGRAFICIGAYPIEVYTYYKYLLKTDWIIDCPLIWTYRNTLGQTPKMKYNLNYQIILHLYKKTSNPLNTAITNEMFSVQDINAPDGRLGNRIYKWQKPIKLAERLIIHTTNPGDKIIDPFVGVGTFIITASENNRCKYGTMD
jgi:hypothetical protein